MTPAEPWQWLRLLQGQEEELEEEVVEVERCSRRSL
jgi:hypothetical protein